MRVILARHRRRLPEGSHLYAFHGRIYLLAAEGGTSYGHCEVAARRIRLLDPLRPVHTIRSSVIRHRRGHSIQATGHADFCLS